MNTLNQRQPAIKTGFQEALEAHKKGWPVFPVKDNKKPVVSWGKYQKQQPTGRQIEKWSCYGSFGVVTGEYSGVVILDIDPGGNESLKGKHLPITVAATTPRGGDALLLQTPWSES